MINLKKVNKASVAAVILAMSLMATGCGSQTNKTTDSNNGNTTITSSITADDTNVIHADDADNYQTNITGSFSITSGDDTSSSVTQNDSVYTITKAGEYTVSGLLSEGQIVVDAADDAEVTIILKGTSITCSTGSPIYVKNADEVKIKSEENTYNNIVDARQETSDNSDSQSSSSTTGASGNTSGTSTNDNAVASTSSESDNTGNAAIYATCDLKFTGKGALSVTANYNNGIQSKDDISIKNMILKVNAVNNAIKGNDAVDIESGEIIAISRKGDGIKTSNSSISSKGNQKGIVTILGGNIDVYAACDGIDAAYGVDVSGDGNLNIYTDTYSEYSEEVADSGTTTTNNVNSQNNNNNTQNRSNSIQNSNNSTQNNTQSNGNQSNDNLGTPPNMNDSQNNGNMGNPPDINSGLNNGNTGNPPDMNNNQNNGNMGTPPDVNNNLNNNSGNSDNFNNNSNNNSNNSSNDNNSNANNFGNNSDNNNFKGQRNNSDMPGNMNNSGNSSKKSYSTKGIKADSEITITGATINISSTDDGIHANSDSGVLETGEDGKGIITVSGGTITISSGDDGIHADKELDVTDGYINVVTSYEGLEAMTLNITGGKIYVYATDDGLNACTGDGTSTPLINITGGYVDVTTASGDTDGIDSNGNYTQSGGMVLVKGGSSSGQVSGSIDVDGTVTVTGGTCVALGGVCETPVNSANAYVFSSTSFNAGSYSVKDSGGNEILSFTLTAGYSNGWICSPDLKTDTEYTLYCDGTSITSWTQTSGTMGATNAGGFGGSNRGGAGGSNSNNGNNNNNGFKDRRNDINGNNL